MRIRGKRLARLARNAAKDFGLGWRVPRAYRQAAGDPIDPRKVLFLESSSPAMPEAFEAMFARFDADPAFDATFVSLGKHRVGAVQYLRNCEDFAREAATARIIFLCDASDVVSALPLRVGTRVIQLWHACGAFKRFGMSTADAAYGLSRRDIERHPFYGNLSLVTVSSPDVRWAYIEAMDLAEIEDIVKPCGVSRTDVFFDGRFHERAFRHVFAEVPAAAGKRIVLYAPTYRGDMAHARAPRLPDLHALQRAIGHDSVVLVKQHPVVRDAPVIPRALDGFAFDVSGRLPIDELLVAADVLVTDYSSVVFEFSLFARPMIFYAPDLDEYRCDRDFYYDYATMAPGPIVSDADGLAACLADTASSCDPARIDAFRQTFMSACDGASTERIFAEATRHADIGEMNRAYRAACVRAGLRRPHVRAARCALNALYRIANRTERADEVVFISRQADEPSYDFAALAREFEQRGWKATMHLKKVTRANLIGYAAHVVGEVALLGRCKIVVIDRYDPVVSLIDLECETARPSTSSSASPVHDAFPARPVVFQLWHAFGAYKKFGFQAIDTPEGHAADVFADYRIHRNCSWVACSGPACREAFAEAFSVPVERVVALDRPELDELKAMSAAMRRRGEGDGRARMRVLMAPTLRKSGSSAHPFRDLYEARARFEAAVDADVVWSFHPLDAGRAAPGNVSRDLLACDVVVTDYSSIVYEAYVLGKPVVFYVGDIASYRFVPGLNSDPLALAGPLCALDEDGLVELLNGLAHDPGSYPADKLAAFVAGAFGEELAGSDSARIIVDFLVDHLP